mgnify:CR=1 FL=1
MLSHGKIEELTKIAKRVRRDIIEMTAEAGSGHPGGSLSCTDILVALYFHVMKVDPQNPNWEDRDRFVLSKGHAAPAIYAVLAEKGFFPAEELKTLRKIGTKLQGHPDMKKTPGIDMTTGSLGQGISAAVGMALAGKLDKKDYRVYAVLGDGELQEGQVWEAAMAAAHYKLDNLTIFVDHNHLQIDGPIDLVMSPEDVREKFRAFNWNVININGHDFNEIVDAVEKAKNMKGRPTAVIAETIKGKGIPFMENQVDWHGKAPSKEQAREALNFLM